MGSLRAQARVDQVVWNESLDSVIALAVIKRRWNLADYVMLSGQVFADQTGTLVLNFYQTAADATAGTPVVWTKTIAVSASVPNTYAFDENVRAPYAELVWTQGAIGATAFRAFTQGFTGGGGGGGGGGGTVAVSLQTAYDGGNTIVEAGGLPVAISSTTADNSDVLTVTKNPAAPQSGNGILITMGPMTTGLGAGLAFGAGGPVAGPHVLGPTDQALVLKGAPGVGVNQTGRGVTVTGGAATGSAIAGSFNVTAGQSVTGPAGAITLQAGPGGSTSGAGGDFNANGGNGTAGNGAGGQSNLNGGTGQGTANGGAAQVLGGAAGAGVGGVGGALVFLSGAGGGTSGSSGNLTIRSGATTDGSTGTVVVATENATGTNRSGGDLTIQTGTATGTGTPGVINLTGANVARTSGTYNTVNSTVTYSDGGVNSTTVNRHMLLRPTINDTGAVRTGHYEVLAIQAVETSVPTGTNYLIRASSGAAGTTDVFTVDSVGNVLVGGKLTVTGAIDPPSLSLSGGTALFFGSADGSTAAVSGATSGRIRYNNSMARWEQSIQGAAYAAFAGTAGSLAATLAIGNVTGGSNIAISAGDAITGTSAAPIALKPASGEQTYWGVDWSALSTDAVATGRICQIAVFGPGGADLRQMVLGGTSSTADLASPPVSLQGTTAYSQATTNKTGNDVIMAPGLGSRFFTIITAANLGGKTFTFLVNAGGGLAGTTTVLTDGVEITHSGVNNTEATNLAAAINASAGLNLYMSATALSAVVYLVKKAPLFSLTISTNAAGGDATATNNADGTARIVGATAGGTTWSHAMLRLATGLTFPDNSDTDIIWDTVEYDTGGYADLGTHPTTLVAPVSGWYLATTTCGEDNAASGSGFRALSLVFSAGNPPSVGNFTEVGRNSISTTAVHYLAAGQSVKAQYHIDLAGSNGDGITGGNFTTLSLTLLQQSP